MNDILAPLDTVTRPLDLYGLLRCPGCGRDGMGATATTVVCEVCHREYSIEQGVVDLAPPAPGSVSVTQRVMESRFYARLYEDVMRPRLTNVVTERTLPEEYRLAAEFLELGDASEILDVACGTANFTRFFARRLASADRAPLLVGVDLSWPMLEMARKNLRRDSLEDHVGLVRADARRLPFRSEGFDRLHCAGALHLMDIDAALREFARLLRPGGICVISTFTLGRGLARRVVKRVAEIPTRFHWFGPGELERRLGSMGLDVLTTSVEGDALTVKAVRR